MATVRQEDQDGRAAAAPPPPPGGGDGGTSFPRQVERDGVAEDESKQQPRNLMAEALEAGGLRGWFTYLTFMWATPFLRLGSSRTLKAEDLEGIYKAHKSTDLYKRLRRNWESERARMGEDDAKHRGRVKGATLLRALMKTFRWRIAVGAIMLMGDSAAHIAQAITLGWLIGYFDDENAASWEGWVYAFAVVSTGMIFSFFHHHLFFVNWVFGMQLRVATTTVLYDKILRLRLSSLGQITTGHLVNLATTDVERFQYAGLFGSYIWEAPLETLVILYFGVDQVGISFLAGFAALALLVPVQAVFSRKFANVRQRVTILTDERVKLTNQAITGARLMKINAWEPALENEICRVRAEEVGVLLKATILRAINEAMFFAQPTVVSFLVFATYHLLGEVLTPRKVFTTLALLNITQFTMGKFFYLAVQSLSESWVSIKRMESILLMSENEALVAPLKEYDLAIGIGAGGGEAREVTAAAAGARRKVGPRIASHASGGSGDATAAVVDVTVRTSGPATTIGAPATNGAVTTTGAVTAGGSSEAGVATVGGAGTLKQEGVFYEDNSPSRPGLISLNGVSFRWTNGGQEDEHAKIFRLLAEAPVGKQEVDVSSGSGSREASSPAEDEDDGGQDDAGDGDTDFALESINLTVEPGKLIGVVGPVGSSKSSLLMAVLREIVPEKLAGITNGSRVGGEDEMDVSVQGSLAYASQEPWIQSGTLRDNILFGKRMNRKRYDMVVRDCALERDLAMLPSGDLTGIGDRGVNLSGGQKARVGLARMAYSHADVYLMDDPLSAVDPAVGRELFDKVVCGRLTGSTRILVTHQVHYLNDPAVDQIVVMGHGKIVARGSYEELEANGSLAVLERPSTETPEAARALPAEASAVEGPAAQGADVLPLSSVQVGVNAETWKKSARNGSRNGSLGNHESCNNNDITAGVVPAIAVVGDGADALANAVLSSPGTSVFDDVLSPREEGEWGGERFAADAYKLVGGVAMHRMRSRSKSSMLRSDASRSRMGTMVGQPPQEEDKTGVPPELVVEEDHESGELKKGTYWEYAREAAGMCQVFFIFLSMAGGQVLAMGVNVWLARWSHQSEEEQGRTVYMATLGLLTVGVVIVSVLRAVLAFVSLVKASHRLHDRMLKRVIRAPILFFDSNPVGRILNRFTKDMHFMDDMLPLTMYDFFLCAFMVVGSIIIVFVVNPWVILSMLPAASYFWYLLGFYKKTSREVKRLEAMTRSPVYSQLSETLDGLVTIRAFGTQHRFLKQFTERMDLNTRAYFAYIYTARWLGFRMDLVVIIVLTASCFFSVAVNEYSSGVDAALLGAALVYVIQLGGLFQWSVRQSAEVENQMVSAERVLAYCRVPQEANLESLPEHKPPDDWPSQGNIEIRDMFLRYREDLPPVLKGLTLSIVGGSRVGVVGRTGAGKSSLVAALFRLVEYDRDRGDMEVDGVDISKIGLHDLRPRMSVVPQTPFLFSGSMRLNLDPFAKQSDVDMWSSLEAVQMKNYVQALPGGLDAPITEGGGNLSVGQRQLLCLARAVLQRSQILVMDEATANIDQHTDSLIQDVVRTSFEGKTVIMVAHRLNTVIDCDQVVVLSEGRVVEAGHPHLLLQSPGTNTPKVDGKPGADAPPPNATLASMVDETGPANADNLRRLARHAWEGLQRDRNGDSGQG